MLKGDTVIITPKGYVKKFEGVVEIVGENSIYVKMDNKYASRSSMELQYFLL